jgi:hypothetical protein
LFLLRIHANSRENICNLPARAAGKVENILGDDTMKRKDWFLIIADGFVWGIGFIAALAVLRGIFQ